MEYGLLFLKWAQELLLVKFGIGIKAVMFGSWKGYKGTDESSGSI